MFEKEAETKLSEEDYKLAEEVIKPIYYNAIKNDYSFAKYGVECYLEGYNKANLKLRNCMNCKHMDTKGHSSCKDKGIVLCNHWEMKE